MSRIVTHDEVELRLTVAARTSGADDVAVLELVDPSGAELPAWSPGAHVDIRIDDGLTRQYSLCGSPTVRNRWRIGVLREPDGRGGSRFIHDKLTVGADVDVVGPRNHFALMPADRYLFFAGGIGITPILPMVAAAQEAGADWELHYGGRSRTTMAFLDELAPYDRRVHLYPQDEVGLIALEGALAAPSESTLIYCCGPEPLLQAIGSLCSATWPEGALHVERFAPKQLDAPHADRAFEVEFARSNLTVAVPADLSILKAAAQAGIQVPSSCQEGTCGTCETVVLCGKVDHRDSLLTDAEQEANDVMFICVSRALDGKLVLDR